MSCGGAFLSMSLFPVDAFAEFGDEGHAQGGDAAHEVREVLAHPGEFGVGDLQDEFVVHLHDDGAVQPFGGEGALAAYRAALQAE